MDAKRWQKVKGLLGLAVYGFYTSPAGQPIFQGSFLGEAMWDETAAICYIKRESRVENLKWFFLIHISNLK